jgi:hypothetical protein
MAGITTYLSILTLNVNRLNDPIKTHHLANWMKRKIWLSVVYKKCTLLTETNIGSG